MPEYRNPPKNSFLIYRPGDDAPRLVSPVPVDSDEKLSYVDNQAGLSQGEEGTHATDEIRHVWL
jgi:hypothetical protein